MIHAVCPRRSVIDRYIAVESKLKHCHLSDNDWSDLNQFHKIMRPVHLLSQRVQSNIETASVALVLPAFDHLLEEFTQIQMNIKPGSYVSVCLWRSIQKFERYRALLDRSSVYFLAVVLDPRR